MLGELHAELQVALADIAGVAREGLLALSVPTGLTVMQAMFEAEVTSLAGPKGKHGPTRIAVRARQREGLGHRGRAQGPGHPAAGPDRRRAGGPASVSRALRRR